MKYSEVKQVVLNRLYEEYEPEEARDIFAGTEITILPHCVLVNYPDGYRDTFEIKTKEYLELINN